MNIATELREMCAKKALFKHGVHTQKSTVEGEGLKATEIEKPAHVTLSTFYYNGLPAKTAVNIRGELRSLVDGSVLKLQGVHQHTNQYTVQYTPKVRGRHQLSITVNGDHVPGSPFSVFVRIPPTKLGKPVRVIYNTGGARYIAFNSSEEMIVTVLDGINVLDKSGTKCRNISLADHGVQSAEGVAVDRDDNVYVTDCDGRCLLKFSREKKLVNRVEGDLDILRGVAVHGDRVWLGDSGNSRVVIFNRDLEAIKVIDSKGSAFGKLINTRGVASDEQGHMYVSDRNNSRVQVFTSEGVHVRTIAPGKDKLTRPTGVCVRDDYVYIVSEDKQQVIVCQKDGQYVTSFGNLRSNPQGVAIDNDSFVYVCCCGSNKILVF